MILKIKVMRHFKGQAKWHINHPKAICLYAADLFGRYPLRKHTVWLDTNDTGQFNLTNQCAYLDEQDVCQICLNNLLSRIKKE